jgi:hypothetical protein
MRISPSNFCILAPSLDIHLSSPAVLFLCIPWDTNEGPIKRLERGEWMGVDKNSSQGMNSAYAPNPQPRTHTSLPRSRSHNGPTNPRNKPQTNPKRKCNSRSKWLRQSAYLGRTVRMEGRTVRGAKADCPHGQVGPYANSSRTTSSAPRNTDRPYPTRGPSAIEGLSALTSRTVYQTSCKRKSTTRRVEQKTRKNSRWPRRTACCQAPRGPSARHLWTVCQEIYLQLELEFPKVNTSFPLPDLPNQPRDSYQIICEGEVPLGDAIPMNLWSQTHWIERNQDSTNLTQKARVPTEILQSKAKFEVWGVKIKHKDAQDIYPWSPQRNTNSNTSESKE